MGTHDRHGILFGKTPRMCPRHSRQKRDWILIKPCFTWRKSWMYQENGCGPVILIEAEWKFYESGFFLMVSYILWSCFVIKPGSGKLVMGFGCLVHLHRPNEIRILGSLVNSVLRWCGDRYPTTALDISEQTSSLSRFLSVFVCVCWAPVTQQQSVSLVCVWVCACVRVVRPLLKVTSGSFRVRRSGTKFCLLFMTSSSQTRKFQPGYWQQKSSILVIN